MNEFEYPEDRGEIYGEPNEEEAWVYFTLNDFAHVVNKYGAQFVLARLNNDAFSKLSEWFYSIQEPREEIAWLLKKKDVDTV